MAQTVRGSLNLKRVVGIDVTTASHVMTALVTATNVSDANGTWIHKIRGTLTGGDADIVPDVGDIGNVTSDAAAAQASLVMADTTIFAVGDHVMVHDDNYTNVEWGRISAISSARNEIALDGNLSNTYLAADFPRVVEVKNKNARMVLLSGEIVNEPGLNWTNIYIRRKQAANVRVRGYVIVI